MDRFTRQDLNALMDLKDDTCVSIFMAPEIKGEEVKKNPIIYKSLLEKAKKEAPGKDLRPMFDRAMSLSEDSLFWSHQEKGLAVFISPEFIRTYRLPLEFREQVVVSDCFQIKPLLRLFMEKGDFYILSFSMNKTRVFHGSRFFINEVEVEDLPPDMGSALRFDVPEKHQEFHTRTSSAKGGRRRPAMFHGQGTAGDKKKYKKDVLRYLQKIDRALKKFLASSTAPLVLAGVDYMEALYREANSYNHLEKKAIKGNTDRTSPGELREAAWKIVEPRFREELEKDAGRFTMLSEKASPLAVTDYKEALSGAHRGKVDILFTAVNRHKWGKYDADHCAVRIDSPKKKDSEDLLELAAVYTIKHNGKVYALDPGEMPVRADIAALLRK